MSVTIKILSADKLLASHTLEKGKPLVLNVKDKVNYELIDNTTGFAPETLLTHRQDNHLLIALNDGDDSTDIVIKNYFDGHVDNLLVGLHENGKMYAYVPVSAKPADAISMLAEQATASQALGSTELSTPHWVNYGGGVSGNWLKVLAPFMFAGIAAAIVASSGDDDDKSQQGTSQANPTPTPPVTPPDTTAPVKPTAAVSANGIVVSGQAEAGSTVTVTSGSLKATGLTDSNGQYSVNLPEVLKNGATVNVTATDAAGNVSQAAQAVANVATTVAPTTTTAAPDTTAPNKPTATVSSNGIVVSGQAEAGSKVTVTSGSLKATGLADSNGQYSVNLPEVLKNGATVNVTATDAAGNVSQATQAVANVATTVAPTTTTVPDTTAPTKPTATVSSNGIVVSGQAEAGSKVTVTSGSLKATGLADSNGQYSVNLPEALKNGETVNVTATDAAGNVSPAAQAVAADTTAPILNAQLASNGKTLTGSTEAGATVSANGVTATADANGTYKITLPEAQLNGETIHVVSTDKAGNSSSQSLTATDSTPPATLTADLSADGKTVSGSTEAGATVSANGVSTTADANGAYSITLPTALLNKENITVIAQDKAGNTTSTHLQAADKTAPDVPEVMISADGQTVSGSTEAGAKVNVNGVETTADANGAYAITLPEALLNGETVKVVVTDEAGNSNTSSLVAPDKTAPADLTVNMSADGLTVSGSTEKNAHVHIDTNQDGQADATAIANANGAFSVTLPTALQNGETVSAIAVDAAGNSSSAVSTTAPVKDVTPPDAPVATLSDDGSTLSGSTEAGATINAVVNGQTHTTTADDTGAYTITLPENLQNGEIIDITATDAANNVSEKTSISAPDLVPPSAPEIRAEEDGSFTITLSEEALTAKIEYTSETDEAKIVTLSKKDGAWTLDDASVNDVVLMDGNVLNLVAQAVKDHTTITVSNADATLSAQTVSDFAADHNPPALPEFKVENDILHITPASDVATMRVDYVGANGELQTADFVQIDTGWLDENPNDNVQIDLQTGVVTLPIAQLQGGTEVSVIASDGKFSSQAVHMVVDTTPPADLVDIIVGNNDAYLTTNEFSNQEVRVLVKLPENGISVGDVLVVNGQDFPIEGGHINTSEYELTLPLSGDVLTVEAFIRDRVDANLVSGSLKKEYTLDTTVPGDSNGDGIADRNGTPRVQIEDAKGSIGYINAEDLNADGMIDVRITFPADSGYEVGDMLHISTASGALEPVALTSDMIANGYTFAVEPSEGVNTIRASVADAAGNRSLEGSDKSVLDDSVLLPPVVVIDKGDDNVLSAQDIDIFEGKYTANITIPAGYAPNSVLNITYPDGKTESMTLSEAQIRSGVMITFDAREGENTISATLTDVSGKVSRVGKDSVMGDFTAPAKAEVSIVGGEDGYLQATDLNQEGKFSAKVMLPENGGYVAGDVLTVSNLRGETHELTLTDDLITELSSTGKIFEFTSVQHGLNQVRVVVKDVAGNSQDVTTEGVIRDNGVVGDGDGDGVADEMGKPVVMFSNVNGDGEFQASSVSSQNGTVAVSIKLSVNHGYSVGDVVHITEPDGTKQTVTISERHINQMIAVNGQTDTSTFVIDIGVRPVIGENTVSTYVVDNEGHQSLSSSDTATLPENTLLPPVLKVLGMGDNGVRDEVSAAEYAANGNQLKANVTLPITAKAGDKLTFTLNNPAEQTTEITLTEADIQAGSLKDGIGFAVEKDGIYRIYATTTNAAGEVSHQAEGFAVLDTVVSGSVSAEDDGSVRITLPSDAQTVVINADGTDITLTYNSPSWNNSHRDTVEITGNQDKVAVIAADKIRDGATVSVIYTDHSGNTATYSAVAKAGGDKDTTAPVIDNVQVDKDGRVVSGSTEAGAIVSANGQTAQADANGAFSITLETPLINQENINVFAQDAAGNTSSTTQIIAPDLTPPAMPTANLSDDGLTVSGSTEAGAKVSVNGVETTANDKGEFSVNLPNALLNKEEIKVIATDAAGNQSQFTFNAGDKTAPVVSDLRLSDNGIVVSGQSTQAGATISVDFTGDGQADATGTADANGAFSVNLPTALINGETISVTATQGDNRSEPVSITAGDKVAPVVPTATLSDDGLTVSGTAEAGSTVSANGVSTTADENGAYSFRLPEAQLNGEIIHVVSSDKAGNTSTNSVMANDRTAPAQLNAELNSNGAVISGSTEAGATVSAVVAGETLSASADSTGAFTLVLPTALNNGEVVNVVATDKAGNSTTAVSLTANDTTAPQSLTATIAEDGITVSGQTEAGATVSAHGASTTADENGAYSFRLPEAQLNGENMTVTATDKAGNSTTTSTTAPDKTAPDSLTATFSNEGDVLSGQTEVGATVHVDINRDGTFDGSAVANAAGVYSIRLTTPLLDGETVNVVAVDEAGNSSTVVNSVAPAKDRVAPDAPTVKISDDGEVVSGTTEALALMTINGMTTRADENGAYSFRLPEALTNGETITVNATDAAQNQSADTVIQAPDLTAPWTPFMEAQENGSVRVILDDEAVSATLEYTGEDGVAHVVTLSKNNGEWTLDDANVVGVSITGNNVTIAPEAVLDDSAVVARNADAKPNVSDDNSAWARDHNPPAEPTFQLVNNDTQLQITPAADASGLLITYVNQAGELKEAEFVRLPQGWVAARADDGIEQDANTGAVLMPLSHLQGDTEVAAVNNDAAMFRTQAVYVVKDEIAPEAVKAILLGDNNDFLTANEINNEQVNVIIQLPETGVVAGEILVVNGQEYVLEGGHINTGEYHLTLNAPAEGTSLEITATLRDRAGNVSGSLKKTYLRDTQVPGDSNQDGKADEAGKPVVVIQDAQGTSGYINAEDINTDGKVSVQLTFPANSGYMAGDILVVENATGTTLERITLTDTMIQNGHTVLIEPEEGVNVVNAYVMDSAGNRSLTGSDKSTLDDSVALPPVLTIVDVNGDGYLNADELKDHVGKAEVKIDIPAGYTVGATLNVVHPNGDKEDIPLTEDHLLHGLRVMVNVEEGNNVIRATLTQISGSVSKESSTAIEVDTLSPAVPKIEIIGLDNKGYFDENDLVDGKLQAKVSFDDGSRYQAGNILTVRDASGSLQTITLTDEHIRDGVVVSITPVAGQNEITASVSDVAGNTSENISAQGIRDMGVPMTPSLFIEDGNDGEINETDIDNDKQARATILLPDNHGYSVGDTLHVNVNGTELTITLEMAHLQNNSVNIHFVPALGTNTITAYVSDAQGNRTETVTATSEDKSGVYRISTSDRMGFDRLDNSNIDEVQASMNDEPRHGIEFIEVADDSLPLGGASANEPITLDMKGGDDSFYSPLHVPMQNMTLLTGTGNDRVEVFQLNENVNITTGEGNDTVVLNNGIANTSSRVELGQGDDNIFLYNQNLGLVDGGKGFDQAHLNSVSEMDVENHFNQIEAFHLGANSSLKLSEKALLNNHADSLSDSNTMLTYSHVLVVNGDNSNHVSLWAGLSREDNVVAYNDQNYHVYKTQLNGSDYHIWVDSDIAVK